MLITSIRLGAESSVWLPKRCCTSLYEIRRVLARAQEPRARRAAQLPGAFHPLLPAKASPRVLRCRTPRFGTYALPWPLNLLMHFARVQDGQRDTRPGSRTANAKKDSLIYSPFLLSSKTHYGSVRSPACFYTVTQTPIHAHPFARKKIFS